MKEKLLESTMADTKDGHFVVEIATMTTISAMQHHPLSEISQSPGHLLLLKLWQREESLNGKRTSVKESRMDTIKRELFQLCSFFFIFHSLFLTILFTSSLSDGDHHDYHNRRWIPTLLSMCTSAVIVFLVQMKLFVYWKVFSELQKERSENRALTRCIQELRMKGSSFDLDKEPQNGVRMKSSSVEIKWKPITWFFQYLVTVVLVSFTGLLFPATMFINGG